MLQLLFPDFFFVKQLPNHEELKKYIFEKELLLTKPKDWVGEVEVTREKMHNSDFQPILQTVASTASECFQDYCLKKEISISFPPDCVWLNKYSQGMWQEYHTHSQRCHNFSFVYFVEYDPEKDGKFLLWNSRYEPYALSGISEVIDMGKLMIDQFVRLDVKEGDLIIFPCFYMHAVTAQNITKHRYTIAGNFLLS